MKICVICSNSFSASNKSQITCSSVCGKINNQNKRKLYKERTNERWKQYNKEYYINNREICRASSDRSRVKYRKTLETNEERRVALLVKSCRNGAIKRNLEFAITAEVVYLFVLVQDKKCALTGIPFDWRFSEKYRSNPFGPSIDRKDSKRGYTYDNIQIVCNMVNVAKSEYPQELFDMMCRARMEKLNG